MKIIVDAFGGDNAPEVPVAAAAEVAENSDTEIILVGKEDIINKLLLKYPNAKGKITVHNAPEIITNNEPPAAAVREKRNSSVVVGAALLREGAGDAFVSAGNTGALLAAGLMGVGRIKGIRRPALAAVLPSENGGVLLLDCGANVGCKPEDLKNFAVMGSIYMKKLMDKENPSVALLSNGQEEEKGDETVKAAHELLKEADINFIGNVEGRDIMTGAADVIVCDGFGGNIALKTIEGTASVLAKEIKGLFKKNALSLFSALLVKKDLDKFKKKFDYKEYGGAPLLGIKKPVLKAHGSSTVKSFKACIHQAEKWVDRNVNSEILSAAEKN